MPQLTKPQQRLARDIWRQCQADLAGAREDRQHILAHLQASGAAAYIQQGIQTERVSDTDAILEQAAALAENTALQQEIELHSQRQFMLQVSKVAPLWVKGHGIATPALFPLPRVCRFRNCIFGEHPIDMSVQCLRLRHLQVCNTVISLGLA